MPFQRPPVSEIPDTVEDWDFSFTLSEGPIRTRVVFGCSALPKQFPEGIDVRSI